MRVNVAYYVQLAPLYWINNFKNIMLKQICFLEQIILGKRFEPTTLFLDACNIVTALMMASGYHQDVLTCKSITSKSRASN